jgi:aromatic ring-opening dioxygenase catalytic subunit (LigB family)
MAEIVGGFGVPHNPHFPTWMADGDPRAPEVERMYAEVARHLHATKPDTLLVFTTDHYNVFFESIPIFSIGVADSARGPSDYPTIPSRELRLDAALAREIQASLVEAGFDVGMLQEFAFDHAVIAPLQFLVPEEDVAVVPVFVSAFVRPIPSARRCYALGRAIREAVERDQSSRRVAVLASGSFSLEIGGPRIGEDSHTGVPAPEWLERVVALLRAGDVDRLVEEATDERICSAGNAAGEILDWIAMLGTIDAAEPAFLDVQPDLGHAYAAWPAADGQAA